MLLSTSLILFVFLRLPHVNCVLKIHDRIVGGRSARQGEFPALVAIMTRAHRHMCGGVLVSVKCVLSAAHCTDRMKNVASNYIVAGDVNNKRKTSPTRQEIKLKEKYVHPHYSAVTYQNDFVIFELENEVLPNHDLKPAQLGTRRPIPGEVCDIAGWGLMSERIDHFGETMMRAIVPVQPEEKCKTMPLRFNARLQFCAGYDQGRIDSCRGDSGGPIICEGERISGIISYGEGCARPKFYGVYADVFVAKDWITSTVANIMKTQRRLGARSQGPRAGLKALFGTQFFAFAATIVNLRYFWFN